MDICKATANPHFLWFERLLSNHFEDIIAHATYDISAAKIEGINNKIKTMNNDFDSLTKMILKMFCVAYVVIFVVLRLFYKTKQALKIISIPLLIILVISMIFVFAGIHLEFFSITGMILVFGLGLDYVIYMVESEKRSEKSERDLRFFWALKKTKFFS